MYLKGKVTCIDVGSIWASLVSVCLLNPLLMELHMHTYAGDVIWQIHDHTKQIIRQWLGIKPKQSLWNQSMSACCSICLWITYIPLVAFFIQCKMKFANTHWNWMDHCSTTQLSVCMVCCIAAVQTMEKQECSSHYGDHLWECSAAVMGLQSCWDGLQCCSDATTFYGVLFKDKV